MKELGRYVLRVCEWAFFAFVLAFAWRGCEEKLLMNHSLPSGYSYHN